MTTSGGPAASSDPKALSGLTVFVPRVQASIHVVTEEDDHDDHNDDEKQPSVFLPYVLREARKGYAKLYEKRTEDVTEALIGRTSLGVAGWSVDDSDDIGAGAAMTSSCWS